MMEVSKDANATGWACSIGHDFPEKGEKIVAVELGLTRIFEFGMIPQLLQGGKMSDTGNDPHRFDFDLDQGIRAQVVEKLERSPQLPLAVGVGPQKSGVYAIYFKGQLVYIGKASKGTTKSKRTLRSRLNEHVGKITTRKNIKLSNLSCRYLTFASEWWVFAAEFALITHYEPEWNASGFGSKTPGKGRPGTDRISRWDDQFPKSD